MTLFQTSLTNLACNDRRVDDELNELVEQLMQKPDTGVQQSPFECSHTGLQLALHVRLGYDDVLQAEGEGVLLQNIHQSEELVQVWILQGQPQQTLSFNLATLVFKLQKTLNKGCNVSRIFWIYCEKKLHPGTAQSKPTDLQYTCE